VAPTHTFKEGIRKNVKNYKSEERKNASDLVSKA
jgi:hypothetical protein